MQFDAKFTSVKGTRGKVHLTPHVWALTAKGWERVGEIEEHMGDWFWFREDKTLGNPNGTPLESEESAAQACVEDWDLTR